MEKVPNLWSMSYVGRIGDGYFIDGTLVFKNRQFILYKLLEMYQSLDYFLFLVAVL